MHSIFVFAEDTMSSVSRHFGDLSLHFPIIDDLQVSKHFSLSSAQASIWCQQAAAVCLALYDMIFQLIWYFF